jgi:hypothetical protein
LDVAEEMSKVPHMDAEENSVVGGWSLDEGVERLKLTREDKCRI